MGTPDEPLVREDSSPTPVAATADPTTEETSSAPAVEPILSATEELVKLRANVQLRLAAVVAGEEQLRQRTQELKQRLAPIRKQIDTLTKTLQWEHGDLATLFQAASEEVQQQVIQLRTLTGGLKEETELRLAMTEAGRMRLRQIEQLTLRPVEAWSTNAVSWNAALIEAKAALAEHLDEFASRWLPDREDGTSPPSSGEPIDTGGDAS